MAFISVFDVIGPNMVGPSSSHTAGAASIALLAGKMIGEKITKVTFTLYGSFAKTYKGHGTDKALVGGILGFETDDMRIRDSFSIAKENGLEFEFVCNHSDDEDIHPNTVDMEIVGQSGRQLTVRIARRRQGYAHPNKRRKGTVYRRIPRTYRNSAR